MRGRSLWGLVGALGALDAFAGRHYLNADAISYLDLADAWARGDWRAAVNAYWSPLYSILLVPVVRLSRTARAWEAPLAHALNFVIFLGALVAFEFFLRSAFARLQPGDEPRAARVWAYALFGRAATALATLQFVTPDLLVATVAFVLAGLLCRIAGGDTRARMFVALGLTAGLGFLAKLVVLVFALVTLALAGWLVRPWRRALSGTALTAATAILVAGPFVLALSASEGHFTLGEAGRLNYIWSLRAYGREPLPARSLEIRSGGATRPRVIVETPRAWAFGDRPGTVPFWYAPASWNRGDSVRFSADAQWRVLVENARRLRRLLLPWSPALLALAILALTAVRTARRAAGWPLWYVALGAAVPFALYLPVQLEPRYVSAALVLLLFVAFVSLPDTDGAARRRRDVIAWLVLLALLAPTLGLRTQTLAEYVVGARPPAAADVAAERLRGLGLAPGDGVAVVGDFYEAQWARVARLRVVAVVDADEAFDTARAGLTPPARVAAALAAAGARAVVSDRGPAPTVAPGEWSVLHGALYGRRLDR